MLCSDSDRAYASGMVSPGSCTSKACAWVRTTLLALGLLLLAADAWSVGPPDQYVQAWNGGGTYAQPVCQSCHAFPISPVANTNGNVQLILNNLGTSKVPISSNPPIDHLWCDAGHPGVNLAMCTVYGGNGVNGSISGSGTGDLGALTGAQVNDLNNYLISARDALFLTGGNLLADQSALNFPSSGSSQTFTVYNFRNEALPFTASVTVPTGSPGDFAISSYSGACGTPGARSVAAAATSPGYSACAITVAFNPAAGSPTGRSGTASVQFAAPTSGIAVAPSNATANTWGFTLSGTAPAPPPPSLSFTPSVTPLTASAVVGQTASVNLGTITNANAAGGLSLNLGNVTAAPSPTYAVLTSVSGSSATICANGVILASGQSCQLWASFTPSSPVVSTGTITVSSNNGGVPNSTTSVTLTGTGVAPANLAPATATLDFGTVVQGGSKPLSQTLTNGGGVALTFTNTPVYVLSGNADFSVTASSCGAGLAANGANCSLSIQFAPTNVNVLETATLTVASSGGSAVLTLRGTGSSLQPPTLATSGLSFPNTVVGQTAAQTGTIQITNPSIVAINYAITSAADFTVASQTCTGSQVAGQIVAGGQSCVIVIQFSPTQASGPGLHNETILVTYTPTGSNPSPGAPASVAVSGTALLPLGLSATALSVASPPAVAVSGSILLTNQGSSPLTLTALTFGGTAAADYALASGNACTAGLILTGGQSCALAVGFTPPAVGAFPASLTISHSAYGSPQSLTLTGQGGQGGQIALNAASLSFAGTQLGSSSAQTVTVSNTGTGPLTFSAFALSGTAAADYQRSGTCSTSAALAAGQTCTLIVTFQPAALGTRTAALTVTSDAVNGPASLPLTGTGTSVPAPQASVSPTTLSFGPQTINGLYPTRPLTLTNTGTSPLIPNAITISGIGFTIAGSIAPCFTALAVGATCTIPVAFNPGTAGTVYNGTLTVTSNDPASPLVVPITGSGTAAAAPSLTWSPAGPNIDFGQVAVGSASAAQTLTLLNNGPGGVTLSVLNTVGANATSFAIATAAAGGCALGETLYGGQSCTIAVSFMPGAAGAQTGSVQVVSADGTPAQGVQPPSLTLTGTGTGGPTPGLALSAQTLSFASTTVGTSSLPTVLTISASGSGAVQVSAIGASAGYSVALQSCPGLPFTLQAGSSCTVTVTFEPQAATAVSGVLSVTTDASSTPKQVVLSGNGASAPSVTSGGCSMLGGHSPRDPTLWALVVLALASIGYRARVRAQAAHLRAPGTRADDDCP